MIFRKFLIVTAFIIPIIGCAECLRLFWAEAYTDSLLLFTGVIWVSWASFSFLYNKDIPGVGHFSYDDGKNQLARIGLLIVIVIAFCLALIF
ncbi:hypothetical protein [Glaciimonas sp. PAMC28666]|uniref:hypothetical protein n=1 Tax=Glaciimonas sp. PAMC28666 TaxID=2807626 RepID=UPI0019657139|nr:hypothetical protein [Glaciimonas sp. PAMC28666]QRX81608.1 hypothetical protein JQN73_15815 [Glaciimonas sp. PAMC28666]